jgi:flagellar biosynthetic protein FlhB
MAQTSEDSDERQLPASERKLREARENGQIPRSREASHAAALLAAIATVAMYGPYYADRALALVRNGLHFDRVVAREPKAALSFAAASFNEAFWATLPLLLAPVLAGVLATMAVGGLVFSMKVVGPNFSKIDPMSGIARLFSVDSLIDVSKLALIAAAVGTVGGCSALGSLER